MSDDDFFVETFRKDYRPVPYTVETISLNFILNEDVTQVEAKMRMQTETPSVPLFLDGREDLTLKSVAINGAEISSHSYSLSATSLTISADVIPSASHWDLEIVTLIKPQDNSLLEGLYKSGGNYCTQCEAQGFRGITYFLDRPDVMSTYSTRVEGDKSKYPVLLSNGNLVEKGDLPDNRHFTTWFDPFPKPCYLFALVAGDLAVSEDSFVTRSGRTVALRIFVQHQNINKVAFAMQSLQRAMKWDEDTFGLEYDLDLFNIVAVDDFNMGTRVQILFRRYLCSLSSFSQFFAYLSSSSKKYTQPGAMENKSLNIFNSRLILASPDTASDTDFNNIEGVVGHEYFHNWTGNRVTCRDWFQLTLKEGLTVYRDQEFTADMNSRSVKRIEDVVTLRDSQYEEDAGPMAHPM